LLIRGSISAIRGAPFLAPFARSGAAFHPPQHFWQRRFYDFNVWTEKKRIAKLRYMHRNPVARRLVDEPDQWEWSSFRYYAYGKPGPARINDWDGLKMKVRPV
jgi:REP element-mobilizing transposase RayT